MKKNILAKKVGKAIANQRKQAGLTQAKVAIALDIETETVSRLETGSISPTLERLTQFSELFNCQVIDFFRDDTGDLEAQAQTIAGLLTPLNSEERKAIVKMVSDVVRLVKKK